MIQLKHIKVLFPEKKLFKDLNWEIPQGSRIGLVGDNGTGKTTLFRIIINQFEPDEGEIVVPHDQKIGYLPQELKHISDTSLQDYLKQEAGLKILEERCAKAEEKISGLEPSSQEFKKEMKNYERILHLFEAKDGYSFEARAKKIIHGLGFLQHDWLSPCSSFSGGWKMRIVLAGLLMNAPDIMLLDEPTNHLDTESLEWLENWLQKFNGTIIVISHDHYFLDKIVHQTAELANQKLTLYAGNYSFYLQEKQKIVEIREKEIKHQDEKRAHLEKFIQRFRYKATKASQVQNRIKQLEKMPEVEIQKSTKSVDFQFPIAPRSGEEVVRLDNITHQYGDKIVFQGVDLTLHRAEKVALVGVNGAGKSTLSRIISGTEVPKSGKIDWGYRIKIAYFSQDIARSLDNQRSIWEIMNQTGTQMSDQEKRNLLGSFLFSNEEIYKKVSQLSGGEKSRLALAKLLLHQSNFLILDEPGNHLDIKTKELFQKALMKYQGTILLVSHDRFFLDHLVERIIEIRQRRIYQYPGNYSYFIRKRQMLLDKENEIKGPGKADQKEFKASMIEKTKKRKQAEQRNQQYRLKKHIKKALSPLEQQINQLEQEKSSIEAQLCQQDTLANSKKVQKLMVQLDQIKNQLQALFQNWEAWMLKEKELDDRKDL